MSTRSNQRFQFSFTVALAVHLVAALAMFEYSRSIDTEVGAHVLKMNWEVESYSPPSAITNHSNTSAQKAPAKKIQPNESAEKETAPNPTSAQAAFSPNPAVMEGYLSAIRDRLGNAIHLHQPRGASSSQLVLKVSINSSGTVSKAEIEKTSEQPEIDRAVLTAFQSLLPLAPFPEEWKKAKNAPDSITLRIPVVIRPKI